MLRIETNEIGEKFLAKAWRGKAINHYAYYSFRTNEKRQAWIAAEMVAEEERDNRKAANKAAKKAARASFKNPYEKGNILYNSWGYEQTNIDFYVVTATTKMTVTIRPIGKKDVTPDDYSCAPMSGRCSADTDSIISPQMKKTIQITCYDGETLGHYIPMKYGSLSLWDGKALYESWYH